MSQVAAKPTAHDIIPFVCFTDTIDSGKEKLVSLKRFKYFWYWNT